MRSQLYIDGQWVDPINKEYMDVINPATEEVLHRVPAGTKGDIDAAVEAAERAFATWGKTTGKHRAAYLRRMAELTQERMQELSQMESEDCGKPYPEAQSDIDSVCKCFNYYADLAEKLDGRQDGKVDIPGQDFIARMRYEPMGVVGAIIPWNFPALMALWKIAPALAAGCTMVLKPSELTPLTALELAAIAEEAQLPHGVLNVVTGTGVDAGAPLAEHPSVRKVAFTGSVPTGSSVMQTAAKDVKNVSLELGGKSPAIVFDSAHIERAVEWAMFGCFWTNGQVCSATSRLLLAEPIADEFMTRLKEEASKIVIGNPMEKNVKLGPLVSKNQQQRVLGFIERAKKAGAKVELGGGSPSEHQKGFFVEPTILTNIQPDMEIWQEEVFGPVLSVMRFSTEEEALRIANDTKYGLASAVFSTDEQQLKRMSEGLEVGVVWNNCTEAILVQLPWGGFKKSGVGRELGPFGLDAYLEPKQICSYVADKQFGWYFEGSA